MPKVLMYTTRVCPYCQMALHLLEKKGVEVEKVRVDEDAARRREMKERLPGATTVPQIFIGDRHIGGYRELAQLDAQGELDTLLER